MLLDQGGSVLVDDWNEVELSVSQHVHVLLSLVDHSLVEQLQTNVQWNLHRQQLSGVCSASDQHCLIAGSSMHSELWS